MDSTHQPAPAAVNTVLAEAMAAVVLGPAIEAQMDAVVEGASELDEQSYVRLAFLLSSARPTGRTRPAA
jgi:hypothetical protein